LKSRRLPWLGILGCLGFFLLSRVPAMRCAFELNVDESMMAAQAMRYQQDLTPWRSVEGESNGPIDSWLILLAHECGAPFGYRTLHILAALCLAATLLASFLAARRIAGDPAALVGLAAGSWWLAWAPVQEFEHYASELAPCLLLSLALAAMLRARAAPDGPAWRWGLGAGVLLGLAPWGKLQAGPVALALGLWAVGDTLFRPSRPGRRYAAALVAGAIAPTLLFLGWVLTAGAGQEFWRAYILGGLYHTANKSWQLQLSNVWDLASVQPSAPWFWDTLLLAIGAACLRAQPVGRRAFILTLVLLAAGLYVTLRPITQWGHYALFCLTPLILLAALCARRVLGDDATESGAGGNPRRRRGWIFLAVAVLPLPVVAGLAQGDFTEVAREWDYQHHNDFRRQSFTASAVTYYVPHPQSLAVWGWKPSLYVDLGLPPAVRSAGNAFLRDGNPSEGLLRAAFLQDLEQSKPEAFVDVEDYVFRGRRRTPLEIFPELVAYLGEHYELRGNGKVVLSNPDYTLVINVYRRVR
jgi:hypothetical protein